MTVRRVNFTIDYQHLTDAYADYWRRFDWSVYANLTFKRKPSPERAIDLFNTWIKDVEAETGLDIEYLRARETWNWRYNPHFHVLLGTSETPTKLYRWEREWHRLAGYAKVDAYDPDRDACRYIAWKLVREEAEVDPSEDIKDLLREEMREELRDSLR